MFQSSSVGSSSTHNRLSSSGLLVGLVLAVCASFPVQSAFAQSAGQGTVGQPAPTGQLKFPGTFDRAAVQELLTKIDEGRNDQVLWGGYFVRNGSRELPGAEGRQLLEAALKAEKPGSLRWLKLQYLNSYVSARYGLPEAGLAAYEAVFQAAQELQAQGTPSARQSQVMARLVDQYVNLLPGPWMQRANRERLSTTLALAFRCWSALPVQDAPAEGVFSPKALYTINWGAASKATGGQALSTEIESQLKTGGNDPYLLLAAADVLREREPERARQLAEKARPLLPKEPGNGATASIEPGQIIARNTWARYRALLVDSYSRQGQWGQSEAVQSEAVAARGQGYAKLAQLIYDSGRLERLESIVKSLETSSVPEDELLETAALFTQWTAEKRHASMPLWTQRLYRAELAAGRQRSAAGELLARTALAYSLMRQARRGNFALKSEPATATSLPEVERELEVLLSLEAARPALQACTVASLTAEFQAMRDKFTIWKATPKPAPEAQPKTTTVPTPPVVTPEP